MTILFKINNKNLYREENLVVAQTPVLFVCKDDDGQRYLTLLLDFDDNEYLVCPISDKDLLAMLVGEIPMRKPFVTAESIYQITAVQEPDNDSIQTFTGADLSDDMLPDDNVKFVIDDHLREYASILEKNLNIL